MTAPTLDVLESLLSSSEPTWGLLVIKATGRPAGTVYPILERLERQGWIRSTWDDDADRAGPRRRLYEFTAEGAVAAKDLVDGRAGAARAAARSAGAARPTNRPVVR
ncbi:helix-turn-helix transcriptional regulator [Curtobacterium sp. UCD-KPL2560]|uniref:PadR family transcriptional regulator n=1 Tax=Curtobacterium sp. UCD-KPL2560 TaxID=1885315 RepID=UPI00209A7402|nr:helix-turn-helix transcriptional regulator [Curtobacterium sp. UCD-KPL2560]